MPGCEYVKNDSWDPDSIRNHSTLGQKRYRRSIAEPSVLLLRLLLHLLLHLLLQRSIQLFHQQFSQLLVQLLLQQSFQKLEKPHDKHALASTLDGVKVQYNCFYTYWYLSDEIFTLTLPGVPQGATDQNNTHIGVLWHTHKGLL